MVPGSALFAVRCLDVAEKGPCVNDSRAGPGRISFGVVEIGPGAVKPYKVENGNGNKINLRGC